MSRAKLFRKVVTFILTVSFIFSCSHKLFSQTYGLQFNAHNVSLDKRTELDLTPNEFIRLEEDFELSFDYKSTRIHPGSNEGFFGYVFRIINSDDKNIDLLSTPTPEIGLNLVVGESNTVIPVQYSLEYINSWISLRVKFMLKEDRIIFYTPDTFYVKDNIGFKGNGQVKIIFGANDYKWFKNSDVPSMVIKDIKLTEKGKVKYFWPLNEKEGNNVTDKIKGRQAKVKNPSWVVLNHQNWQKNFAYELNGYISVAVDYEDGNIFMLEKDGLLVYSTRKNNISEIKYKNKPEFMDRNIRAVYNPVDKNIYCYLVEEGYLYSLDMNSMMWDDTGESIDLETKYRHHNSYFSVSDNSIYLFGGYGRHRYNNEIIQIDIENKSWNELPVVDTIFTPRYLAGLGQLNDTIYIFGGYGSISGNQLINPQSYFDLIGYSIKNKTWFKKFEVPRMVDDMIVANSMWIDEKTRNYYALVFSKIKFENELQLICGSIDTPEVEMVGNKIPFNFLDIRSNANLYYMATPNKLFAYTSYSTDSTTQVAIYSIDNPPNKSNPGAFSLRKTPNIYFWLIVVACVSIIATGLVLLRKRKKKAIFEKEGNVIPAEIQMENERFTENEDIKYQILFFGGFQVFNKEHEDITQKFSPLLKELYLLILLNTFRNNKGVSSEKITETLWYDKDEKSARNNRAVNIAKLRSILEEIGSCELSHKTGYWKINFRESEIKGDYFDFLNITSSKKNLTKQKIYQLIEITRKGAFLLNVHYNWLDDFKADVSDKIIDTLVEFAKTIDTKKEADLLIHVADCIFNFDVINEEAMIIKCKAQYCMGKHSHAKATYEKFFKEYKVMYAQEYDRAFVDILDIKE